MTDYQLDNKIDNSALWIKEAPPVSFSGVSRFRRWLFPALTATFILILIIVLGVSNMRTSTRLWSVEQSVSNLSNVIQSLNTSLQHAQERAKEVKKLQFAVENNKDQLTSVSEALKQLSAVDSLSRSIASLRCSLEHIINNSSAAGGCCPLGWEEFDFSCYFFSSLTLSWNESRAWCDQQEAHLLILHSDKAWDFVTRRTTHGLFWVGLSDWRTGQWEWVNQTPYTMERRRWVPGQPDGWVDHGLGPGDEDCAHLHASGHFNDLHCSTKMRFVCQRHSMRP
ncbi:LOW QUALITY PROTEIN: C-type lectin domain family 10 member A-like [Cottoperca gobio]|uniref:LOW QUALITY PROTEIN: C-type lectin domain family 10 member A-like n=1 Tax=Cottoperca gobio TaxID=56716 RepID=A0A6J2PDW8_COTGO|nr:LOW QUALITY PROTEIN: C-type lectin domain family 10 member A-like [Cottoperca gobio]